MTIMLRRWSLLLFLVTTFAFSQSPFWEPTAGPLRISVSAMAVNSQGHIFAGTYTRGMYRSTDHGASWVQMNNGLPESRIYAIGISRSPRNHDNIFVATRADGVFRSYDNGNSWHRAGLADTATYIEALTVDSDGNVFVSSHHTWNNVSVMYRSSNNGAYWTNVEIDNPLVHTNTPFLVAPTKGKYSGQIFAGTNWGVYRTQNDGDDWQRVVPVGYNFAVTSFAANYRGDMYASATDSSVYRSTDEGQTWERVGVTEDKVLALSMAPNGVLFAATYGKGVYRSLDDGASWHSLNSGLEDELMLCLAYAEAGEYSTYMYTGGTGLGTFRSRYSTTPFALNRYDLLFGDVKVGRNRMDSVLVTNRDTTTLVITSASSSHEYYSITPKETTLSVGESAWFYSTFAPGWYGTFNGKLEFRNTANSSPDEVLLYGVGRAPDTWLLSNGLGYGRVLLGQYSERSIRLRNIGNDTLRFSNFSTSDSVFTVSSNTNEVLPLDYAEITVRFTPRLHGPYAGFAVLESNSMSSPDTIWLNGFGRGYPLPSMSIHEIKFGNVKVGKQKDTSVTVTNIGEDTLWISKTTSSNSEFSITIDHAPLPPGESRTFSIRFYPFAKGEVFGEIYIYSNALSSPDVISVHGLGDPASDVIITLEGKPTEFVVYQNYPNPFNPATTIRFALPVEAYINITLYNQLGIEVARVADEVLPAGYYNTSWRNNGLPTGVYYYRMVAKSVRDPEDQQPDPPVLTLFDEMKKLVLVK